MSLKSRETELSFKRLLGVTAIAFVLSFGLSACSTSTDEVLDAANPANWFADDETIPGSDEEYPKLGEVPDRPVEPEIKREYEALQSGLVADVQQAQYSDEQLRSQTVPDSNLSLVQAKKLPDPATPVEPPVASAAVETPPSVQAPVAVAAAAASPDVTAVTTTPVASPAPAPEPLTPSVEQLASQQATPPPASAASIAAASPNVMPNQNASAASTAAPTAAVPAPAVLTPKMIATIYFEDGSSSLTSVDQTVIAQVVEIYKQGGKAIFITGHSSSTASANDQVQAGLINFKMSLNRANAVADAFHAYGIPKSLISVEARGANTPRFVESNDAGIAGNRRAEIYIAY